MAERYGQDQNFRCLVNMLGGLAFVPQRFVIDGWMAINGRIDRIFPDDNDANDLKAYFASSFIGSLRENGTRGNPQFSIEKWNQYQNVISARPRTNNRVEGWHNGLNHWDHCHHPNIFRLVDILKKDMDRSRVLILQNNPAPQRSNYRDLDSRIFNLCSAEFSSAEITQQSLERFIEQIGRIYHFY